MYVKLFSEGNAQQKDLLGGKGANLCEMAALGLPVPAGVIITTEAWKDWNELLPDGRLGFVHGLAKQVEEKIRALHDGVFPLVSVRSGARVSMPGMMDTLLNIGLTKENFFHWEDLLGERAVRDCRRRQLEMFGSTVHGIPREKFDADMKAVKTYKYGSATQPQSDADLTVVHLSKLIDRFWHTLKKNGGDLPDTIEGQLAQSITAVFESWNSPRAKAYRSKYGYPDDWGTAVTIQRMVFGNLNDKSCSGVLFSRDPSSGENCVVGEFLPNAQGEDVVAGIRTPFDLTQMYEWNVEVYSQLVAHAEHMEQHYRDMQDMEFTVEDGKLYVLQTRNGKRSAQAAFKIAHDLYVVGIITMEEALKRVTGDQYLALRSKKIDPEFKVPPLLTGIGASGFVVSGVAVFTVENAINCTEPCILIRAETNPEDFAGMNASAGILTSTGGATSHAAVVARGMDKPCVVGATDLKVMEGYAMVGTSTTIAPGDKVTIDGSTGNVWVGVEVPIVEPKMTEEANKVLDWVWEKIGATNSLVTDVASIPEKGIIVIPAGTMTEEAVISVLKACAGRDVYVDFLSGRRDTDAAFLTVLKATVDSCHPSALAGFAAPGKIRKVRLPSNLPAHVVGMLAKEWAISQEIASWDELMDIEKDGFLNPEWLGKTIGLGVPVAKIVGLLKSQGKNFDEALDAMPFERQVFEVLGK